MELLHASLTLGERSLDSVSQDDGGSLKVQTVECGRCHLCWDPLTTWTLHKIEDIQGALCSRLPGHPHHLKQEKQGSAS